MGKSQKKRSMRRHNPVRVPDSHIPKGLAAASSASSKNEAILPIIQKMSGPEASERKWACVAVSNLIQNDPSTRRLLQGKNVVGALITRLSDNEEEVAIEATGALRNLCIDGGYDICAEMYNKNILAPLKEFIPKISNTLSQYLTSPASAPENAKQLIYEFADSVITILWCLSETSSKALKAVNALGLVPFLCSFLSARDKLPASTVTSAAQCLYVLTDENLPVINEVRANSSCVTCLLTMAQAMMSDVKGKSKQMENERYITQQVLACGILRNISPFPPPSGSAAVDVDREVVLPALEPVIRGVSLGHVAKNVEAQLAKLATEPSIEKLSLKNAPKSDHRTAEETELARTENQLRTVQLALEILTGVCATLPDPSGEDPDADNGGEVAADVDMDDEAHDEDAQEDGSSIAVTKPTSFLPPLVEPLIALIQPSPLSFPIPPSPYPPVTSALAAIHISALECLNNVFFSFTSSPAALRDDVDGGLRIWQELWTALAAVGFNMEVSVTQEPARRKEYWDTAIGVLWGVGMIWKGHLVPQQDQIQILLQLCNKTTSEVVRVKCIGVLECLAQHPQSVDANRVIAEHLLALLPDGASSDVADTEVALQATSALIDIYSDEALPYDVNFRQGRFLEKLAASIDGVKRTVRGIDRKREGGRELRLRGEEVRDNLVAFVQYRRDLRV
ncbi:ARM repeat-containing protein [Punctularia strigosozonata HHB-11173 SS5]|uniref:ARM repeat-containing protein n=1 Tax=Punctularia strigosozonata (strain HHB-11173) TaxID=741275 RepID=UPI0004416815|nr:ARM repeat-containing protein [Punctularia strigosozonata HHB-11173 SS5]EIN13869.1 ARM repeat-containing protein [Punctularia strigosozonata HHB-11173 SS5]